jgi:hypothetical protein
MDPENEITEEDRKAFEEIGELGLLLAKTSIDAIGTCPSMTRRGLVNRVKDQSFELERLRDKLAHILERRRKDENGSSR